MDLENPEGYGRVVHAPGKRTGTHRRGEGRHRRGAADPGGERRPLRRRRRLPLVHPGPRGRQERPARVLPHRPGGAGRRRPGRGGGAGLAGGGAGSERPGGPLARGARHDPAHRLGADGVGRHPRGPGALRRRRGGRGRPGHRHRALRPAARDHPHRRRLPSSARARILVDIDGGRRRRQSLPYCHFERARIAPGCRVGPFTRLRPELLARRGGPRGQLRGAEEDLHGQALEGRTTSPTSATPPSAPT